MGYCFMFSVQECTPCVTAVEQRVSFVTKHPGSYAEGIQVLRYEKGGRYAHHMDWFDPKAYSSNANLMYDGQTTFSATSVF